MLMLASNVVFLPRLRGTESCSRSPLWVRSRRSARGRCASRTRRRKPASLAPPLRPPSSSRPPLRTHRARWLIAPLFPGGADPDDSTAHGGATHAEPAHDLHVVAAISEGGKGALL